MHGTTELTDADLAQRLIGYPLDHDNKHQYAAWLDRRLIGLHCRDCARWSLPVRQRCPWCWSANVDAADLSGKGTIFCFTVLHQAHTEPSAAATIELAEQTGLRTTGALINCPHDEVRVGMAVELVWEDVDGVPNPRFQPADVGPDA